MSLLPKGHEGPLFHSRMIRPVVGGGGPARGQTGVSQRAHVGFLRSRPPAPHRISLRLAARLLRLPLKGGVIALGARASRPHPVPLAAAELQCDAAGSHPVGGNSSGQAEGEPWRRSRLIQVGEMAEPVPGLVRAGRPRSRGGLPPMTGSHQRDKSAEAFWRQLSLKEVHLSSGLFVFIRVHSWFVFINDRPFFLE